MTAPPGISSSGSERWILVVSHFRLWPNDNGTRHRIHVMLRYLRRHYRICVVSPDREADSATESCDEQVFARSRYGRWARWVEPLFRPFLSLRFKRKYGWWPPQDTDFGATSAALAWARGKKVAAIVAEKVRSVPPAVVLRRVLNAPIVLDIHAVYFTRTRQQQRLNVRKRKKPMGEEEEKRLWGLADLVLAIQREEADVLKTVLPPEQVLLVEHAVEPKRSPAASSASGPEAPVVLCVASKAAPNLHGLEFFLDKVWPRVREALPPAVFEVAGNCRDRMEGRLETSGVRFLGRVEHLGPCYRRATVVVNPVLYGSGLKIKCVEALAYGCCLLTTPVGAQGLEDLDGTALVIAQPDSFADELTNLLRDSGRRATLKRGALQALAGRFSEEACFGPLLDQVRDLRIEESQGMRPPIQK